MPTATQARIWAQVERIARNGDRKPITLAPVSILQGQPMESAR